jgi:hypothetical protein
MELLMFVICNRVPEFFCGKDNITEIRILVSLPQPRSGERGIFCEGPTFTA